MFFRPTQSLVSKLKGYETEKPLSTEKYKPASASATPIDCL